MSKNRRDFFTRIGSMSAGLVVGTKALEAQENSHAQHLQHLQHSQTQPSKIQSETVKGQNIPMETPDLPKLPWKMVDGAKEFHVVAEHVRTEFVPGRVVDAWG